MSNGTRRTSVLRQNTGTLNTNAERKLPPSRPASPIPPERGVETPSHNTAAMPLSTPYEPVRPAFAGAPA